MYLQASKRLGFWRCRLAVRIERIGFRKRRVSGLRSAPRRKGLARVGRRVVYWA
ncbi:hypothetical protein [Leisingera daeponensis]|uniref:hypothetical protein n=1 Tax=Leisingera daeponensis TaxID=405746 RepID=UPI001C9886F0|nr:hypothetical protein [Leisingera daeponensis]MBY6058957.1 hypothetical protein [Leisingera daeponensis]